MSVQHCTAIYVLREWYRRWLVASVSQRSLPHWTHRTLKDKELTLHHWHAPLQELWLKFPPQTGSSYATDCNLVWRTRFLTDYKARENFCMLSATRRFQFQITAMKVAGKKSVYPSQWHKSNVQIQYVQNTLFLLYLLKRKKNTWILASPAANIKQLLLHLTKSRGGRE